jgi:hypothetical protein
MTDAEYINRLEKLIRWLARSYGDNEPVWHFQTFSGNELPDNIELADTWRRVVRGEDQK